MPLYLWIILAMLFGPGCWVGLKVLAIAVGERRERAQKDRA